jgi:ATP-binding cassette subfamily B protein/subfamily B ATP-binding cassette protein MsbA
MRRSVILASVAMLGVTAADLLSPWPLKVLIDNVLLGKPASGPLAGLTGLAGGHEGLAVAGVALSVILIALLRGVCAASQLFHTSRLGYELSALLQRQLFDHLQRLSLGFHSRARSGELLTKVTSDTKNLRDIFADSLLDTGAQLLTLVGMAATMIFMNWRLSLVVLASFPVLACAVYLFSRQIKLLSRNQRKLEGVIAARISEGLATLPLVQAFGRERYEREQFAATSAETLEESIRAVRTEAAGTRAIEIISAAGIAAVVLFGGLQALRGTVSPGELLIFITYVTNMYKPVRSLARLSTRFSKGVVSAERIGEILDAEPEVVDRRFAVPASSLRGRVEFRGVAFDYGDGKAALRDVSFTISAGQRVALVGASGAGKSTIVSMILRFYDPRRGAILIDGVDIRDYQRESLRQQIGVVLQDSLLLSATVRENIAYAEPAASDAEVEAAARLASAHDFITALPQGYDTPIGERGATLSGGQRQRLSLARALIKRPAILILDEPTSAMDAESARSVEDALTQARAGQTTLVIAHHFVSMERFDQILVLRDGLVVEQGTNTELLARRGFYYDLWRLQAQID